MRRVAALRHACHTAFWNCVQRGQMFAAVVVVGVPAGLDRIGRIPAAIGAQTPIEHSTRPPITLRGVGALIWHLSCVGRLTLYPFR